MSSLSPITPVYITPSQIAEDKVKTITAQLRSISSDGADKYIASKEFTASLTSIDKKARGDALRMLYEISGFNADKIPDNIIDILFKNVINDGEALFQGDDYASMALVNIGKRALPALEYCLQSGSFLTKARVCKALYKVSLKDPSKIDGELLGMLPYFSPLRDGVVTIYDDWAGATLINAGKRSLPALERAAKEARSKAVATRSRQLIQEINGLPVLAKSRKK